jgi:hypothetical protein
MHFARIQSPFAQDFRGSGTEDTFLWRWDVWKHQESRLFLWCHRHGALHGDHEWPENEVDGISKGSDAV